MNPGDIVVLGALILGYGLVSKRIEATSLTAPMLFVALGAGLGAQGLGILHARVDEGGIHILAELTLVLVLFGDAARIDLRALRKELGLPLRLLGIGMPLTILLGGWAASLVFPNMGWAEAGVLAAVLAPTDAALGQAVVSSSAVPLRIRQALNVESGLNDGIAVPVVMILAAACSMMEQGGRSQTEWMLFAVEQVTLGPTAGFVVGWLGGKLIQAASGRAWMEAAMERLAGLAMALLAFGAAELVGGNGFIAAFIAGLTLGNTQRKKCEWLYEFLESEGQLLMLLVFFFFGATVAVPAAMHADSAALVYALLSLTVIRMLPVALSMVGSQLRWPSVFFLGWFGPRGLATVLFAIVILDESHLPHGQLVFDVAMLTALFSVVVHGVTATPFSERYGRSVANASKSHAEHRTVAEHPTRRG